MSDAVPARAAKTSAGPPDDDLARLLAAGERRAAWVRGIVSAVALAGAFVIGHVVALPKVSLCTFQILFARPCPGCGMTRSIAALARGDVAASLRLHPLGIVLFAGAALGLVGAVLHVRRGRDPFWELIERRGTWVAVGLMMALVVLWLLRAFVVPEWSPDPVGVRPAPWPV